ncbi:hypothetical protein KO495_01625 [Colwellia sp. D2M02]|uniref:hypothetical protein n=1 Tax=Colwellia sp. D2M02 TaxID=2841562 RepID=UPI001C094EA7|nr:hypothetical protein [Colwellia sp. D2M02]MBU2892019.1 hypothetical protein [Colwellia sp. D2M02]
MRSLSDIEKLFLRTRLRRFRINFFFTKLLYAGLCLSIVLCLYGYISAGGNWMPGILQYVLAIVGSGFAFYWAIRVGTLRLFSPIYPTLSTITGRLFVERPNKGLLSQLELSNNFVLPNGKRYIVVLPYFWERAVHTGKEYTLEVSGINGEYGTLNNSPIILITSMIFNGKERVLSKYAFEDARKAVHHPTYAVAILCLSPMLLLFTIMLFHSLEAFSLIGTLLISTLISICIWLYIEDSKRWQRIRKKMLELSKI